MTSSSLDFWSFSLRRMFDYPDSSQVNRVVPKARIYASLRPTTRMRDRLTQQVQEIRWAAKLAPETIRIVATKQVPEIQVFRLLLKGDELHLDVLDYLDKAIPQPLIFELRRSDGQQAYSAAFKRPSEAELVKWVLGARFTTDFSTPPQEGDLSPLPASLDLERLYAAHFAKMLPLASRAGESLESWIERCQEHRMLERKVSQLTSKVNNEKQFNRRVELNRDLNTLKSELELLCKKTPS